MNTRCDCSSRIVTSTRQVRYQPYAQANPNPNELARKAADELARSFTCGKDEVKVIGETGRAVSIAKR